MLHFYDAQVRRYITQTIRIFSNFTVKYGDGSLHRIPVMYGDADRQVASIVRQNSENKVNSVPKIAVYISSLALDRSRTGDASFVGKMHFRERDMQTDPTTGLTTYSQTQGRNYTVERLMPTPFKLSLKVDIWAANTDQKLQILEQILVLFNPSLELQTTDNYIDWTSLSVLDLTNITWSSRSVPVGVDTPIDIASLTVETPIWISPPVKVKHLGVITKIVTSLWGSTDTDQTGYIEGLGEDLAGNGATSFGDLLAREIVTITDYTLQVYNNTSGVGQAVLLSPSEGYIPRGPTLEIPVRQGVPIDWASILSQYPGKFTAGSSRIFLIQSNGAEVSGTVALPVDGAGNVTSGSTMLVNWDRDSLVTNTGIDSTGKLDFETGYNASTSYRPNSPGTFDAIVNPLTFNPGTVSSSTRYLIIEDIGSTANTKDNQWTGTAPGTTATNYSAVWGTLVARANDIIEYNGTVWQVVFNSAQHSDTMVWQTNIYTGVQYLWNGVAWIKSFEGEYQPGSWRLEL